MFLKKSLQEAGVYYYDTSFQWHYELELGRTVGWTPGDKSLRLESGGLTAVMANLVDQQWPCWLTQGCPGLCTDLRLPQEGLEDRGTIPQEHLRHGREAEMVNHRKELF